MQLIRRRLGLLALLAFEGAAAAILHGLGSIGWLQIPWSELGTWLEFTPVEDVLAAVLRQIGLVMVYWLLGTTVLYLAARATRIPTVLRSIEWATVPAIRRVIDGAVAVSIATASIATPVAPVLADTPPPVVVEVDEHGHPVPPGTPTDRPADGDTAEPPGEPTVRPAGPGRIGWTPSPAGSAPDTARPLGGAVDAIGERLRAQGSTDTVLLEASIVVMPGDHLWSISRRRLEHASDGAVSNDAVASYWRRVIDANRDRLHSGDPDLIYPGETVLLPPIDTENQ